MNFQKSIEAMNAMYRLPIRESQTLEAHVARMANFQIIIEKEQAESKDLLKTFNADENLQTMVGIADWLGDLMVYTASEALKWNIPFFVDFVDYDQNEIPILLPVESYLTEANRQFSSLLPQIHTQEGFRTWVNQMTEALLQNAKQARIPLRSVLEIIMASNESKLGADGNPIYDENGKFDKGPNYWKPEPLIEELLKKRLNIARASAASLHVSPINQNPVAEGETV